jgi:hypothetical protein
MSLYSKRQYRKGKIEVIPSGSTNAGIRYSGDMAVRGLVVAKDREYALDDDTGMRQRHQDH